MDAAVTETRNMLGMLDIRIVGPSRTSVEAAIAEIKSRYGWGYGTQFGAVIEIAPGRFEASGSRARSCD